VIVSDCGIHARTIAIASGKSAAQGMWIGVSTASGDPKLTVHACMLSKTPCGRISILLTRKLSLEMGVVRQGDPTALPVLARALSASASMPNHPLVTLCKALIKNCGEISSHREAYFDPV
jgi:hypothetical protein